MVFLRVVVVEGSPWVNRLVEFVVVVEVAGAGAVGAAPGVVEVEGVEGKVVGRAVAVGVAPVVVVVVGLVVVIGVAGAGAVGAAPGVIGVESMVVVIWAWC